jgi:hypothetical protein
MTARETAAANVARLANGLYDQAKVDAIVAAMSDEQVAAFNQSCADSAAERAALRDRLMANDALRSVVCPPNTWRDSDSRYDVTRALVKLVERWAAKHEVTMDDLVAELVRQGDSIAHELEMYGDEAVSVQWGRRFYGFTWRLQDAVNGAKREETQRAWAAEVARHEAMGEKVCDRCGGAGGFAHWPGFTCYECGGRKFV